MADIDTNYEIASVETCKRAKKHVYGGYIYRSDQVINSKQYLLCVQSQCHSRGVKDLTTKDSKIRVTKAHNHKPDKFAQARLRFKHRLNIRAEREITPIKKIIEEECAMFPNIAEVINCRTLEVPMIAWRKRSYPKEPSSLKDYSAILVSDEWRFRFGCTRENPPREFFIGSVQGNGGEIGVIFASPYFSNLMNQEIGEIHIDSSYKKMPDKPGNIECLLSIHLAFNDHSYATAFALLSNATLSGYLAVLQYLKDEMFPCCKPNLVCTSFESNLQDACHEVFPDSVIHGQWFYFVKDVYEKSKQLGLFKLDDETFVTSIVSLCMALPMLPPDLIAEGLESIETMVVPTLYYENFRPLVKHIRIQWFNLYGYHTLSINSQPRRSNLNIDTFHNDLNYFPMKSTNKIWNLTECLQLIEHTHRTKHQWWTTRASAQGINKNVTWRKRDSSKCKIAMQDSGIIKALVQLNKGKIHAVEFLVAAKTSVDAYLLQAIKEPMSSNLELKEKKIPSKNPELLHKS